MLIDFEQNWPRLMEPGYRIGELPKDDPAYDVGYTTELDTLHNLGCCLVIAGALATAALGALQAGIDLGMELVAKTMQEDAMRAALKGQQSIIAPSRQLILPGSEGWGK